MLGPAFAADLAQLQDLLGAGRADDQHKAVLAARQAGKSPQVFFKAAREMPWRSAADYQPFINLPELSYPSSVELQAQLGFNIICIRADQLPHADAYMQGRPLQDVEIAARYGAVMKQVGDDLSLDPYMRAVASRLTPAFVGAYDVAAPVAAQAKCQRLSGEGVHGAGILLMAHQHNNDPLHHATFHCRLDREMVGFIPERSRLGAIFMHHEITHAAQRAHWKVLHSINQPHVANALGYIRETDADAGGMVTAAKKDGLAAGELSMYVAFRAISMVTQVWMLDADPYKYGGAAMFVARGLNVSQAEAVGAQVDLKLRIAAQLMDKPVNLTPQEMTGNVQKLMAGHGQGYHPEFIRSYNAFNYLASNEDERTKGLLWRPQGISHGLDKVWHGGEKLSPLTLRMAAMAVEGLNLYRQGPC